MVALLDVNVLIALIDSAHKFHHTAKDWALKDSSSGWASCPLTQNGCIRIISQPSYPPASAYAASDSNASKSLPVAAASVLAR